METTSYRFERIFIGFMTIVSGLILIYLALAGPLWLEWIHYRTSPSAIYQTVGQDLANLLFLAPVSLIGGCLYIRQDNRAKYVLILLPIYLIYVPLSYGIGMEWSLYEGNSELYFPLFLFLMITGLILLIVSLSMFQPEDAPEFSPKMIKWYSSVLLLFLLLFAAMWLGEVREVIRSGDTSTGSYVHAPTLFWVIRYLDLGITIPLGLISTYMFLTRPRRAYPLLQLTFGFFTTMIIAVNMMGWNMVIYHDPETQPEAMVLFSVLAFLAFLGYYQLVKGVSTSTEEKRKRSPEGDPLSVPLMPT